jgi:hypothetical protein
MAITSARLMTEGWLTIFACLLIGAGAAADPIQSDRIQVVDGDTIHITGTTPDVRLVSFNAPETTRGTMPRRARARRNGRPSPSRDCSRRQSRFQLRRMFLPIWNGGHAFM